jgi:hypothetical protein
VLNNNMSNSSKEYSERILSIVNAKSKHLHQHASKNILLIFQVGFLVGWLARLAKNDITIKQEIDALEKELDIHSNRH